MCLQVKYGADEGRGGELLQNSGSCSGSQSFSGADASNFQAVNSTVVVSSL
jgi:hypothetical protein